MAQNCRHCTEQGKNQKPILGKGQPFQMEPVVEPNEEVPLDFARPLPDELNREAYILVAIHKPSNQMVQTLKRRLAVKKIDRSNTPYKLA